MVSQDFIDQEEGVRRRPAELYYITNGIDTMRITSGDITVTYNSNDYTPALIMRGPIKWNSDLSISKTVIKLKYDLDMIDDYINQYVVDTVWVEIYKIHRDMSPLEAYTIFVGKVEAVAFSGNIAEMQIAGLTSYLNNVIPKFRYQSVCNHALYSPECGLDPDNWDYSGVVSDISSDGLWVESTAIKTAMDTAGVSTDNYCQGGYISYGGYVRYITRQSGAEFYLRYKIPTLSLGEIVTVYAGCDNRNVTCRDKFNNIDNFLGFPFIPWDNPVTTVK